MFCTKAATCDYEPRPILDYAIANPSLRARQYEPVFARRHDEAIQWPYDLGQKPLDCFACGSQRRARNDRLVLTGVTSLELIDSSPLKPFSYSHVL